MLLTAFPLKIHDFPIDIETVKRGSIFCL
uniref:Uncharacterized protein n=1 Tax=Rhizophora mucronata TaxID=61149 RepID=A0A2P2NZV1_RHIMU